jgi:hypothetical protein
MWSALSDWKTGLFFTIAASPRQGSHSQVRVPWYSRPCFTVSNSRPTFLSPPTSRRATMQVFDLDFTGLLIIVWRRTRGKHILYPVLNTREPHRKHIFLYCFIYSALHNNKSYPIVVCVFVVAEKS